MGEREQYKGSSASAMKENELKETYAMMQEEILMLNVILQEAEAANAALPMLLDANRQPALTTTPVPSSRGTDMIVNQVFRSIQSSSNFEGDTQEERKWKEEKAEDEAAVRAGLTTLEAKEVKLFTRKHG